MDLRDSKRKYLFGVWHFLVGWFCPGILILVHVVVIFRSFWLLFFLNFWRTDCYERSYDSNTDTRAGII